MAETYLYYSGFALMSMEEANDKARAAANNAIILNEKEPRAHKVLAYIHLFYDWDWDRAIEEYNKAVAYGLPDQNEFISYYYIFIQEDFDKAIQVAESVLLTDPLHVISHWQLGLCFYFARRFEEALNSFSNAIKLDADFGEAHRFKGLVLGYLGRYEEAMQAINKALEISNGEGIAVLDRLVVKILMGEKEEVLAAVQDTSYIDSSDPAFLYSLLNMPDEALFWLEKTYQERSGMMVTIKNFWVWDNLRADSRFQAICDRMQFPEVK